MTKTEVVLNLETLGGLLSPRRKYYVPTNVLIAASQILHEYNHNPKKVLNRLGDSTSMVHGTSGLITGRLIYDLIYALETLPE